MGKNAKNEKKIGKSEDKEERKKLVGDPPALKKVKPLHYGFKIKKMTVRALVLNGDSWELVAAKAEGEDWLLFKTNDGRIHKVLITTPPATMEYMVSSRLKTFFPFLGRFGKFREWGIQRILVWGVGYRAEATHNLGATEYDIPAIQGIVGYSKAITDTDVIKKFAEEIKAKKGFWEMFPYIALLLTNLFWMIFVYSILDKVL